MLSYALGRGLEYYDQPTVHQIVKRLEEDQHKGRGLIMEIVKSLPFQYRRNAPLDTGQIVVQGEGLPVEGNP